MKRYRIGVHFDMGISCDRDMLRGVEAYERAVDDWLITPFYCTMQDPVPDFRGMDGIIGRLHDTAWIEQAWQVTPHLVVLRSGLLPRKLARVIADNYKAGCMAADYFLRRGFRHFVFYGHEHFVFSLERWRGFTDVLRHQGIECAFISDQDPVQLPVLLRSLPKPCAVLADRDRSASHLCRLCRELEIMVPDELAILGVGNDTAICQTAPVPVSSVVMPDERIGYEAARILDGMLRHGGEVIEQVLPPVMIEERNSTDALGVSDPFIRKAVSYLKDNVHRHDSVERVSRDLHVTPRTLERRFRQGLGQSPLHVITRLRVELAMQILRDRTLTMEWVAHHSGFGSALLMRRAFGKHAGITPSQFRASVHPMREGIQGTNGSHSQ
ncbi:MAG: substrate-binding domain-containing protein [Verrucomicrobiota bacterium]|nr:substrate-binding domain-containing protein [Verrucomicrobiota bacterium]